MLIACHEVPIKKENANKSINTKANLARREQARFKFLLALIPVEPRRAVAPVSKRARRTGDADTIVDAWTLRTRVAPC